MTRNEPAFVGYVNPNQNQSVIYGTKSTAPRRADNTGPGKKVAKPGERIVLTEEEFEKLCNKGLHKKLLVVELPNVVGGEAPPDNYVLTSYPDDDDENDDDDEEETEDDEANE